MIRPNLNINNRNHVMGISLLQLKLKIKRIKKHKYYTLNPAIKENK
jgi:hypothetical protein